MLDFTIKLLEKDEVNQEYSYQFVASRLVDNQVYLTVIQFQTAYADFNFKKTVPTEV